MAHLDQGDPTAAPVTHALPAPAQTRAPVLLRLLLCCFCVLFYIWYSDNLVEDPKFRKLVRAARYWRNVSTGDVISALAHGRKRPDRHTVLCWLLLLLMLLQRVGAALVVAVVVAFVCVAAF